MTRSSLLPRIILLMIPLVGSASLTPLRADDVGLGPTFTFRDSPPAVPAELSGTGHQAPVALPTAMPDHDSHGGNGPVVCDGLLGCDAIGCDSIGCCEPSGCCKPPWYKYYVQADALFWQRGNSSFDQPLVVTSNNDPVLTSRDLDFDYDPGLRVTLGVVRGPCGCCSAWEFGFLGLWESGTSAQAFDPDNLNAAGLLGFGVVNGFVNADAMRAEYSSDLYSFEANCVKCLRRDCWEACDLGCDDCCDAVVGPRNCVNRRSEIDLLYGLRYVRFEEDFALVSDNLRDQVDARYDVDTINNLYGFQIGARWREYRNRLGLEAVGKAGIYFNDASQRQSILDQLPSNPVSLRDASDSSSDVAFLGEVGISLLYELNPSWTLRAGYSLLWLEGVALAPDQLDFNLVGGDRVDVAGGVFYHGATVGIEYRR